MNGLDVFREWFGGYEGQFVIIGGMAAYLVAEDAGLEFRGTKDIDIVLCLEAIDAAFIRRFWEFVTEGGYESQNTEGKRQFYRFRRPQKENFPFMLELFSRKPDAIVVPEGRHLTPIPVSEEVSSLSAILLDEHYYECLLNGRRIVQGLPVLGPQMLIPFKAYAYLNLRDQQRRGERVSENEKEKHRRDVFRLLPMLGEDLKIDLPAPVKEHLAAFVEVVADDKTFDPHQFGAGNVSADVAIARLRSIYSI